jgi:hypothetical protein
MRWENLTVESGTTEHGRADAALFGADAVTTRTFDTPEFAGITFHEVRARSIVNRVPGPPACRSSGRSTRIAAARTRACTAFDDPIYWGGRMTSSAHADHAWKGMTRPLRPQREPHEHPAARKAGRAAYNALFQGEGLAATNTAPITPWLLLRDRTPGCTGTH